MSLLHPCRECGAESTDVMANPNRYRPRRDGAVVYRAHKCRECGRVFHTVQFELADPASASLTEALLKNSATTS